MPSIAGHFAIGCEIERRLGVRNDSFLYGCVLPDFMASCKPETQKRRRTRRETKRLSRSKVAALDYQERCRAGDPCLIHAANSHYYQKAGWCEVPDVERFLRETALTGAMKLGYLVHLLSDERFLSEFCPREKIDRLEYFTSDKIYDDYCQLNELVIDEFGINLERANRVLCSEYFDVAIDDGKYEQNVAWINRVGEFCSDPRYIKPRNYFKFIRETVNAILADERACKLMASELGCKV